MPRGFGFVEFVDAYDASEAQYHMNRQIFGGREITVVLAAESRKRPEEMRGRARPRGPSGYDGRRSSYYGRSRSRSVSRSRSPRYSCRVRQRSRSYSPALRYRGDHSVSPRRRQSGHTKSPRENPQRCDEDRNQRSHSPSQNDANHNQADNRRDERGSYDAEEGSHSRWRSPRQTSGSPPGSRSRSADSSPRRSSG